jgi:hypothetical protein
MFAFAAAFSAAGRKAFVVTIALLPELLSWNASSSGE